MQRVEIRANVRILARTSHENPFFDVAIRVPESVSTYHVALGSGCRARDKPVLSQVAVIHGFLDVLI